MDVRIHLVAASLSLAGCHDLFNLDRVSPATLDSADSPSGDARTDGLVARYTMDTVGTISIIDSIGNRDAKCTSCPSAATMHIVGLGALAFGGKKFALTTTGDSALDLTEGGTVALWLRLRTLPSTTTCVVSKVYGATFTNSFQICFDPGASMANLKVFWLEGGSVHNVAGGAFGIDSYVHVAFTWNKLASELVLYVDGAQFAPMPAELTFDGGSLVIGGDLDDGALASAWDGDIDDLRIYDRVLTAAQISSLYDER